MINSTQQAIEEFGKVTAEAKSLFGTLSPAQLNWKTTPEKWSIAQCLDHLIVSNSTYYPQLEEIYDGKHQNSFYQNIRFISRFFGNHLIRETGPVAAKPMKSPPAFAPSQSELAATVVSDFEKHQRLFISSLSYLDKEDLDKTILYSPAIKAITYSFRDLLTILVGHEQRHLAQAKNVLNHPNFPK